MGDAARVEVVEGERDLADDGGGQALRERAASADEVVEVAKLAQLQDEVDAVGVLEGSLRGARPHEEAIRGPPPRGALTLMATTPGCDIVSRRRISLRTRASALRSASSRFWTTLTATGSPLRERGDR